MEENVEVSISLTIPELILAVAERSCLTKEEVEKVIYAFIEHHLKRFKLK